MKKKGKFARIAALLLVVILVVSTPARALPAWATDEETAAITDTEVQVEMGESNEAVAEPEVEAEKETTAADVTKQEEPVSEPQPEEQPAETEVEQQEEQPVVKETKEEPVAEDEIKAVGDSEVAADGSLVFNLKTAGDVAMDENYKIQLSDFRTKEGKLGISYQVPQETTNRMIKITLPKYFKWKAVPSSDDGRITDITYEGTDNKTLVIHFSEDIKQTQQIVISTTFLLDETSISDEDLERWISSEWTPEAAAFQAVSMSGADIINVTQEIANMELKFQDYGSELVKAYVDDGCGVDPRTGYRIAQFGSFDTGYVAMKYPTVYMTYIYPDRYIYGAVKTNQFTITAPAGYKFKGYKPEGVAGDQNWTTAAVNVSPLFTASFADGNTKATLATDTLDQIYKDSIRRHISVLELEMINPNASLPPDTTLRLTPQSKLDVDLKGTFKGANNTTVETDNPQGETVVRVLDYAEKDQRTLAGVRPQTDKKTKKELIATEMLAGTTNNTAPSIAGLQNVAQGISNTKTEYPTHSGDKTIVKTVYPYEVQPTSTILNIKKSSYAYDYELDYFIYRLSDGNSVKVDANNWGASANYVVNYAIPAGERVTETELHYKKLFEYAQAVLYYSPVGTWGQTVFTVPATDENGDVLEPGTFYQVPSYLYGSEADLASNTSMEMLDGWIKIKLGKCPNIVLNAHPGELDVNNDLAGSYSDDQVHKALDIKIKETKIGEGTDYKTTITNPKMYLLETFGFSFTGTMTIMPIMAGWRVDYYTQDLVTKVITPQHAEIPATLNIPAEGTEYTLPIPNGQVIYTTSSAWSTTSGIGAAKAITFSYNGVLDLASMGGENQNKCLVKDIEVKENKKDPYTGQYVSFNYWGGRPYTRLFCQWDDCTDTELIHQSEYDGCTYATESVVAYTIKGADVIVPTVTHTDWEGYIYPDTVNNIKGKITIDSATAGLFAQLYSYGEVLYLELTNNELTFVQGTAKFEGVADPDAYVTVINNKKYLVIHNKNTEPHLKKTTSEGGGYGLAIYAYEPYEVEFSLYAVPSLTAVAGTKVIGGNSYLDYSNYQEYAHGTDDMLYTAIQSNFFPSVDNYLKDDPLGIYNDDDPFSYHFALPVSSWSVLPKEKYVIGLNMNPGLNINGNAIYEQHTQKVYPHQMEHLESLLTIVADEWGIEELNSTFALPRIGQKVTMGSETYTSGVDQYLTGPLKQTKGPAVAVTYSTDGGTSWNTATEIGSNWGDVTHIHLEVASMAEKEIAVLTMPMRAQFDKNTSTGEGYIKGEYNIEKPVIASTTNRLNLYKFTDYTISGNIWQDKKEDGIKQAGDTGMNQVVVKFYSAGSYIGETKTDAAGSYTFTTAQYEDITVEVVNPDTKNYVFTKSGNDSDVGYYNNGTAGVKALGDITKDMTVNAGLVKIPEFIASDVELDATSVPGGTYSGDTIITWSYPLTDPIKNSGTLTPDPTITIDTSSAVWTGTAGKAPTNSELTFTAQDAAGVLSGIKAVYQHPLLGYKVEADFIVNVGVTYAVEYDTKGGTPDSIGELTNLNFRAAHLIPTTDPTRKGYTFDGWKYSGSNTIVTQDNAATVKYSDLVNNDPSITKIKLEAQWTAKTYTVNYNTNGGKPEAIAAIEVGFHEANLIPATDPTRAGYTFAGWQYDDANTITQTNKGTKTYNGLVNNDDTIYSITLTAQWTKKSFTVDWQTSTGGTIDPASETEQVAYQGYATKIITPTADTVPELYGFIGWYYNYLPDGKTDTAENYVSGTVQDYKTVLVLGDITFTAKFAKDPYVNISASNGYVEIADGTDVPAITAPKKTDATVEYQVMNPAGENAAAAYAPQTHYHLTRITIEDLFGHAYIIYTTVPGETPDTTFAMQDSTITVALNRTDNSLKVGNIQNSLNIYVTFAEDPRYNVYFYTQAPSDVTDQTVPYGQNNGMYTGDKMGNAPVLDPVRPGYEFKGWTTDGTKDGAAYDCEGLIADHDETFYAVWDEIAYTVLYDSNGGTPDNISDKTVNFADTKLLPQETVIRMGYDFAGWQYNGRAVTDDDAYYALVNNDDTVRSIQLVAQWTAHKYKVVFDKNAQQAVGSMADQEFAFGEEKALHALSYAYSGYTFAGWSTDATIQSDSVLYADEQVVKDLTDEDEGVVTLYAQWNASGDTKYQVEHYKQQKDGTFKTTPDETKTLTGETDTKVTAVPNRYKGYVFVSNVAGTVLSGKIQPDGSLTLKLYYKLVHTVSFDSKGGNYTPSDQKVIHGNKATDPKKPTKYGYIFQGWYYKDADGNLKKYNFSTPVTKDIKLYAQWKKDPNVLGEDDENGKKKDQDKNGNSNNTQNKQTYRTYQTNENSKNSQTTGNRNNNSVQTGDVSTVMPYLLMLLAAIVVMLVVIRRRARR